ncbi:MAG: hypothetical protein DMG14_26145 [Acidobacteria bacterium]|nr:MAG: hypothetical protein DMG14_26145 [Acidobacteriota bacterium]
MTQAVLDAVKQWRYKPTLLNGAPVSVVTTINVASGGQAKNGLRKAG